MMSAWARYLYRDNPRPFARFATAVFGIDGDDGEDLAIEGIERLEAFFRSIGAPTTLREVGVPEEGVMRLAENAAQFAPFGVLRALSAEDISEICKLAW
jgi:alcohol dehydrogenase YqhD (iron-dependent ADH family)